jgi:hypothetical protein
MEAELGSDDEEHDYVKKHTDVISALSLKIIVYRIQMRIWTLMKRR